MTSAIAPAWTETDIRMSSLCGTLTPPAGDAPVPAVLILAGSGPVDRNGNLAGMQNNSLQLLAHGLAANNVVGFDFDCRRGRTRRQAH